MNTHKTLALALVVASLGTTVSYAREMQSVRKQPNATISAQVAPARDSLTNVAIRLQARIEQRFGMRPSLMVVRSAVAERRRLFANSLTVQFYDKTTKDPVSTWMVSMGRYPEWVAFNPANTSFIVDREAIARSIAMTPPDGLTIPSSAVVTSVEVEKVQRAQIEGTVQDGQEYDVNDVADTVGDAFVYGERDIQIGVTNVRSALVYNDGVTTYTLHELGVGRSEFASSPYGRKMNIRKAMNEKANGIVIPQGATFSFNATLGGPITNGNGWYDSLIIVNGKDLEPAPGGGICQATTTVFRAAVSAGLPIVKRKSHSLYVTYYKKYGMGLDAAVFPGKQDMLFENDTQGPLILVGKTDEYDNAYSMIYGVDDGRKVVLDGPYFGSIYKEPVMGQTIRSNQVGWVQRVQKADGTTRDQLLVAQYLQLPKSVALEFKTAMHTSADLIEDVQ